MDYKEIGSGLEVKQSLSLKKLSRIGCWTRDQKGTGIFSLRSVEESADK